MKARALSAVTVIFIIVFSSSLSSAGWFWKIAQKYLDEAYLECTRKFNADRGICLDLETGLYEEGCMKEALKNRDKCIEPEHIKEEAKKYKIEDKEAKKFDKILKKIEKNRRQM